MFSEFFCRADCGTVLAAWVGLAVVLGYSMFLAYVKMQLNQWYSDFYDLLQQSGAAIAANATASSDDDLGSGLFVLDGDAALASLASRARASGRSWKTLSGSWRRSSGPAPPPSGRAARGHLLARGADARLPARVGRDQGARRGREPAPARGQPALQQCAAGLPRHRARRALHARRLHARAAQAEPRGAAARGHGPHPRRWLLARRAARRVHRPQRRHPLRPRARLARSQQPKGRGGAAQGPGAAGDDARGDRGRAQQRSRPTRRASTST